MDSSTKRKRSAKLPTLGLVPHSPWSATNYKHEPIPTKIPFFNKPPMGFHDAAHVRSSSPSYKTARRTAHPFGPHLQHTSDAPSISYYSLYSIFPISPFVNQHDILGRSLRDCKHFRYYVHNDRLISLTITIVLKILWHLKYIEAIMHSALYYSNISNPSILVHPDPVFSLYNHNSHIVLLQMISKLVY